MKFTTIKLPDDFEKGMCHNCPFSYEDEQDISSVICVFHCRYDECPLEIGENNKLEQIRNEIAQEKTYDMHIDGLVKKTEILQIIDKHIKEKSN